MAIHNPHRRGASATELAIVLPFVVLFTIAVVDLARYAVIQNAVCEAAHRGARFAATRPHPDDDSDWRDDVEQLITDQIAAQPGLDPALLQIDLSVVADDYSLHRVNVRCQYPFRTLLTWPGVPQTIPLSTTVSLRRYR